MFDTFKFIIPKEDDYMELSLCLDSREYIETFYNKLLNADKFVEKLVHFKFALSKVLNKLLDFALNRLAGKIRSEYSLGEIVPHRQIMIAKVGILTQTIRILSLIFERAFAEVDDDELLKLLEIDGEEFSGLDNLLEVIIKTLQVSIVDNMKNTKVMIKNLHIIQNFTFVEGCTALLIEIFKDKSFELNKKEIHSELLYRRIFEIERFKGAIEYFTERVKEYREFNLLMILRKMCIIGGNALPLVQDEVFKRLYESHDFFTRYKFETDSSGELWVQDNYDEDEIIKRYTLKEFMDLTEVLSKTEERLFLLEQLTLEADL